MRCVRPRSLPQLVQRCIIIIIILIVIIIIENTNPPWQRPVLEEAIASLPVSSRLATLLTCSLAVRLKKVADTPVYTPARMSKLSQTITFIHSLKTMMKPDAWNNGQLGTFILSN